MDTVSFIVPVWNVLPMLGECVGSILSQRGCEVQVILVDDGSTDGSGELCDRLAASDGRIEVVHKPNGGPSSARNAALPLVRGEFVAFVDADDLLLPWFARTLLGLIAETGADMAMGGHIPFSGEPPRIEPPKKRPKTRLYTPDEAIERALYQRGVDHSAWAKLYRREVVVDEPYVEGALYEDLEAFPRFCRRCRLIASTSEPVYLYRRNASSILHTFSPRRLDVLRMTAMVEGRFSGEPRLLRAARDRRFAAAYNMLILCSLQPDVETYAEAVERCRTMVRDLRREVLVNSRSRLKNRLGALLSYLGPGVVMAVARRMYTIQ